MLSNLGVMISPPVGGPTRMDCPKGVNHSRAHQLSGINMKQGSSAIASRSRSRGPLPSAGGDDTPCIGLSPPDLSCTSDVQSSFFSSQPSSLLKDLSTSPAATEFYDAVAEPSKTDARRSTKKHCFLTDMCCCGCLQSWKSSTGKPESEPLKQRPVLDNCCTGSRVRYHVRVAGPSMSGKTAFLRYLKHGQFSPTQPTKGEPTGKLCSSKQMLYLLCINCKALLLFFRRSVSVLFKKLNILRLSSVFF